MASLHTYSEELSESDGWQELKLDFSESDGSRVGIEVYAQLTKAELDRYFTVMGVDEAYESGYNPGDWSVQKNGTVYRNPENWPSSIARSNPDDNIIECYFDYENNGILSNLCVFIGPSNISISTFNPPIPEGMQTDGFNKFVLNKTPEGIHLECLKAGWEDISKLDLADQDANENPFVQLVLMGFITAIRQLQLRLRERMH